MGGWGDEHDGGGHDGGGHDVGGHDVGGHDVGGHDVGGQGFTNHESGASLHGWEQAFAGSADSHLNPPHLPGEHERLDLNDADHLPWLEGDDDDFVEKVSIGRVIAVALAALLLVGGLVGGIWYATHRHALNAPVADGSTVTPPSAQYKDAPTNPGGKTFQGTGDTSYVVSQGQNRQAQLAEGEGNAASGNAPGAGDGAARGKGAGTASKASAGKPASGDAPGADAAPAGGVVQIGAFSSKDLAEAGWSRLAGQHPTLAQQHHRILQGQADIGTVFRLQIITGAGGGNALCERLKAEGLSCQVKH